MATSKAAQNVWDSNEDNIREDNQFSGEVWLVRFTLIQTDASMGGMGGGL